MNYELAKELNNAGYPLLLSNMGGSPARCGNSFEIDGVHYYLPDLSELIEACGAQFGTLTLVKPGEWQTCGDMDYYKGWTHIINFNSTPEEAVARLWLALNRKE